MHKHKRLSVSWMMVSIVLMLAASKSLGQSQWWDTLTPNFQPSIPSASGGDVFYTYSSRSWARTLRVGCDAIESDLIGATYEFGKVGGNVVKCRGYAEEKAHPINYTCSSTWNNLPFTNYQSLDCIQNTYGPDRFGYTDGNTYLDITEGDPNQHPKGLHFFYETDISSPSTVPGITTTTYSGPGWTMTIGRGIWTGTQSASCQNCPAPGTTGYFTMSGYWSYFYLSVHVTNGFAGPGTIPAGPGMLPGGPSGGIGYQPAGVNIGNPGWNSSGNFTGTVTGVPNTPFTIQYCPIINTNRYSNAYWVTLVTGTTDASGSYNFTDVNLVSTNSAAASSRFYRVKDPNGKFGVDTIGFSKVTKPSGKANIAVANQFNLGTPNTRGSFGSTLGSMFSSVPSGTVASFWNPSTGTYSVTSTFSNGSWSLPYQRLAIGKGFFLNSMSALNLTFYGYVPQGTITNSVPSVSDLVSASIADSGKVHSDLGMPLTDGMSIYRWNVSNQVFDVSNYSFGSWDMMNSEPSINLSEGFFIQSGSGNWSLTYNTGQ